MKRKSIAAALLLLGSLLFAGESTDYWTFGENRANLPGPEILSSVYVENPAACADAIRNSIAFGMIGLFGPTATWGTAYTLLIPSFGMVGITEDAGGIRTDLLGVQFGLSSRPFLPALPVQFAGGFSLLRATRTEASVTASSFRLDMGLSAAFASLKIEALVQNAVVADSSAASVFGPAAQYGASVGGKLILDIDCMLGVAYSPALAASATEGVEMVASMKFIRYFFDNSLRAGMELSAYADFDNPSNVLPVVEYGLALSYVLPDFFPGGKSGKDYVGDLIASARSFLRNLSIDGSALILVNTFPDHQGMRAIVGIGLTKFY